MKFGGTSMGSADRIRTAAQLSLEQQRRRPVLAVVSAMSKITDLLLETLTHAEAGRPEVETNLKKLKQRHFEACEHLLPAEHPGADAGAHGVDHVGVPAHRARNSDARRAASAFCG